MRTNSVDTAKLTPDTPAMKNAEHMDRSDKLVLRKSQRLIDQGAALVAEGQRLRRALYMRLTMRAKRSDERNGK